MTTEVRLFMLASRKINNMLKYDDSANNGTGVMEFGSFDSRENSEHDGAGFVKFFCIFAMQGNSFLGKDTI